MKTSRMALLLKLEECLRGSQGALLSRDVARLEQLTAEQASIESAFSALILDGRRFVDPADSSAPADSLRAAATRVRYQAQVQRALLRRAQQSLRMLSRLMAGTQPTYVPPGCLSGQTHPSLGEVEPQCRV